MKWFLLVIALGVWTLFIADQARKEERGRIRIKLEQMAPIPGEDIPGFRSELGCVLEG